MKLSLDDIYRAYMYSYPHKTAYGELTNINYNDYYCFLKEKKDNSLYVHIPFCEAKCGYCNLFSVTGKDQEYYRQYVDAILIQFKQSGLTNIEFRNFILGGGTPLLLSEALLEKLFCGAETIGVNHKTVFTGVETSPSQVSDEKLCLLKEFFVNRISIGIQSFIREELKVLNRNQDTKVQYQALERIKKAEFDILNIDLIYGIQGQSMDSLRYSVNQALTFAPDELFIYPLYIRNNTSLWGCVRNETTYEMYWLLREHLLSAGYVQTSMRRFTKKAEEYASCGFENTISFGCGGRSYLGNLHYCTRYFSDPKKCGEEIDHYIKAEDKTKITHGIILNQEEEKRRYVIKNLLHEGGIHLNEFEDLFNNKLILEFPMLENLMNLGYIQIEKDSKAVPKPERLILTSLGMSLSDFIGPMFISDSIRKSTLYTLNNGTFD